MDVFAYILALGQTTDEDVIRSIWPCEAGTTGRCWPGPRLRHPIIQPCVCVAGSSPPASGPRGPAISECDAAS